jgi:hypothetical protein
MAALSFRMFVGLSRWCSLTFISETWILLSRNYALECHYKLPTAPAACISRTSPRLLKNCENLRSSFHVLQVTSLIKNYEFNKFQRHIFHTLSALFFFLLKVTFFEILGRFSHPRISAGLQSALQQQSNTCACVRACERVCMKTCIFRSVHDLHACKSQSVMWHGFRYHHSHVSRVFLVEFDARSFTLFRCNRVVTLHSTDF